MKTMIRIRTIGSSIEGYPPVVVDRVINYEDNGNRISVESKENGNYVKTVINLDKYCGFRVEEYDEIAGEGFVYDVK